MKHFEHNSAGCGNVSAKTRFAGSSAIAAMAAILAISPARAAATDEASFRLEDIVVTAQKRQENLQEVPIAIATVSTERLETTGVNSPFDLGNAVAGLQINNTVQSFSPHVRGVGTTSFGPGVESPVALYVDNVYYGSPMMAMSDLGDVAQLAVLKGPQGTLFGRNATGGVLQITTLEPEQTLRVQLSTELDNYMTSRSLAHVSGGLSGTLRAGVTVKYATQGEGWGQNLVTGNDVHRIDDDFSVRSKLIWEPTDALTVRLAGDYAYQRNSLGANVVAAGPAGIPDIITFGPSTPVPTVFDDPDRNSDYDTASSIDNRNVLKGGGGSLQVDYDLDFAKAVSITAYRQYKYDTIFDTDPSSLNLEVFSFLQKGKQFTQELQLVSNSNQRFTWALGGFYFWSREKADPISSTFELPSLAVFPGTTSTTLDTFTDLSTKSMAVFAQGTYKLTDATRFTAGIRYTHEKRTSSGYTNGYFDNFPAFTIPIIPPVSDSLSTDRVTWRLSLDQDLSDDVMVYASYNRGFKSGGFNGFNPTNAAYRPEKIDAYELGFKTVLADRTLRFNPSAFYYKYSEIQITTVIPPPLPAIVNAAGAEIYGIDLDAEWSPADGLHFNLGAEWLSARFTSYPNGNQSVPLPGGGNVTVLADLKDKRVPFAAKFSLNFGIDYEWDMLGGLLKLSASDAFNSGYPTEPDNRLNVGSYHIVNAGATWTDPSGRISVGVFGRNLADEHVPAQLSTTGYGDEADFSLPPRTYGISLGYRFGG